MNLHGLPCLKREPARKSKMPPGMSEAYFALIVVDVDTTTAPSPLPSAGIKRPRIEDGPLLKVSGIEFHDVDALEEEPIWTELRAAGVPADVPEWEVPMFLQGEQFLHQLKKLNRELAEFEDEMEQQRVQLGVEIDRSDRRIRRQMEAGFSNIGARLSNIGANIRDPLTPLVARNGRPVPNFPRTRADLATLTRPQLAALLQAYGQAVPQGLRDRRRALARFIGVRIN